MKTVLPLIGASLVLLLGAVSGSLADKNKDQDDGNGGEASRIQIGFNIAPVPLDVRGKNRALVGLGSYLVNAVGGCNDCHTAPPFETGGDPYLGQTPIRNAAVYLAGGGVFGPFISRNLTPDSDGLPAGLSFADFEHIIRTGEDDENPGMLLQVMPWPVYAQMSDRDLRAIYAYLSSIPSLPNNY